MQILEAFEVDESLVFKKIIASLNFNRIYLRGSFRSIAREIIAANPQQAQPYKVDELAPRAIVTGEAGVGKSVFLFYLLCCLLKERGRVFFWYGQSQIYFDESGTAFFVRALL